MLNIGIKIREFREECGKTQEQVAEEIGIARNLLSRWENGVVNPPLHHIDGLAKALGKTAKDFFN